MLRQNHSDAKRLRRKCRNESRRKKKHFNCPRGDQTDQEGQRSLDLKAQGAGESDYGRGRIPVNWGPGTSKGR